MRCPGRADRARVQQLLRVGAWRTRQRKEASDTVTEWHLQPLAEVTHTCAFQLSMSYASSAGEQVSKAQVGIVCGHSNAVVCQAWHTRG